CTTSALSLLVFPLISFLYSRLSTPLGHTDAQSPQPTQEARTTSCPRWAYQRTSLPISQYVEQLPQEMHCPLLDVMRNLEKYFCCMPSIAAIGQPKRHQTRLPIKW